MPTTSETMTTTTEIEKDERQVVDEVVEEDWSGIMTSDLSGGFAQHDCQEMTLKNGKIIQIASVSALSPLDMIDLSWGTHDATGHRIWTGAMFFLHLIPKFERFLQDKRILELGSGTGLAGIAISKYFSTKQFVLTDSSSSALELCRLNRKKNNILVDTIEVSELYWGNSLPDHQNAFDTVLATDVLYDIASWGPLMESAKQSLKSDGAFILSHVPRAALPEDVPPDTKIEDFLIEKARLQNFILESRHYPRDFSAEFDDWLDMDQAGVGIFVFRKG